LNIATLTREKNKNTNKQKLTLGLPCPWAEIGKSRPREEPIRLLKSLLCPLERKNNKWNFYSRIQLDTSPVG